MENTESDVKNMENTESDVKNMENTESDVKIWKTGSLTYCQREIWKT